MNKYLIYLAFISFGLCNSCSSEFSYLIPIEELNSDAHEYALNEETVEIIGEVTMRTLIPDITKHLNEIKGYIISDGSGSIIVKTQDYVPKSGEFVQVTGILKQTAAGGIRGNNLDAFAIEEETLEILDRNDYCDLKSEILNVEGNCWSEEY